MLTIILTYNLVKEKLEMRPIFMFLIRLLGILFPLLPQEDVEEMKVRFKRAFIN